MMIQHTVLFKFPSVADEVPVDISEVVTQFNTLQGIVATFEPHGVGIAGSSSKEEFLGKVEWPDKTDGYTHCLLVVAADDAALKAYLHSDLHLKSWTAAVKPFATGPPLVFDNALSPSTVAAVAQLQAKTEAAAAKAAKAAAAQVAAVAAAAAAPPPSPSVVAASVKAPANAGGGAGKTFVSVTKFGFDAGGYNDAWVSIYVTLPGIGAVKSGVDCKFTKDSFDLTVTGLGGKNYRLLKTNLEKDVVPSDCKTVVKADKIIVKLKKVKGDYSYESWQGLTSKKDKAAKAKTAADPSGGIMDMMKDMYDSGDDSMKKIIGEAMLKSKQGKGAEEPSKGAGSMFDDDSMGGMGGLGGM